MLSNTWREIEREGDSHNERKPRFARLDDDQQHGEVEGEREPETAVSRSALETRPQQKYMPQYWMDRGEKMIAGLAVQLCEGRGLWDDDHGIQVARLPDADVNLHFRRFARFNAQP